MAEKKREEKSFGEPLALALLCLSVFLFEK